MDSVVDGPSPLGGLRRSVKARPVGLSPWKQVFLKRCEQRVKDQRAELLESLRHKGATASDLMTDLVADEHARCRDENQRLPAGSASTHPKNASGPPRRGAAADDEDDDDRDLTEDERIELLLYLQATLCCDAADDDEAQEWLTSVHDWERAEVEALVEWADDGGEGGGGGGGMGEAAAAAALPSGNPFATPSLARGRAAAGGSGGSSSKLLRRSGDDKGGGDASASPAAALHHRSLGCGVAGSSSSSSSRPPAPATPHSSRDALDGASSAVRAAHDGILAAAESMMDDDTSAAGPGASAASAASAHPGAELAPSEVLCPICRRRFLFCAGTAIGCRCGFRMNTAGGMTIHHLQQSLATVFAAHRAGCASEPVFQLRDYFGVDALWMWCEACEDLQVVL
jgi:hypothetical protein